MTGRLLGFGLLGFVVYAVSLLATLPADRTYEWVRPYIPAKPVKVEPYGLTGTLWKGKAETLVVNGDPVGSARWTLRPLSLLAGRAALDFSVNQQEGFLRGVASVSPAGTVRLADAEGRMPIAFLTRYAPFVPVVLDGLVSSRLEEAQIQGRKLTALIGTVVWHQAEVIAPQPLQLGDLRMTFSQGDNGAITGSLSDGGGPLEASGELRLEPDGSYRFRGRLASRDPDQPALASSLRMLGSSDGTGGVRINLSGKF